MAGKTPTPSSARGVRPTLRAARARPRPRCPRPEGEERSEAPRWPDRQAGYTMVEFMVVVVASATVFAAMLTLLITSLNVQARDSEYALTLQEDRTGLSRMVREIRQATKIEEAKAGAIYFLATIGGIKYRIKYECSVAQPGTSYTECVRLAAEESKALPVTGPPLAKDILNGSEVFTYSPSSEASKVRLATVKLEIPAKGTLKQANSTSYTHHVVLEDAAYIRPLYLEG